MGKVFVSIIVPIYNVSAYIERCIDSVISQKYSDIECIFVDDCSSDNSLELTIKKLNAYSGNINFRLIHHNENKGLSEARNTGIYAASGNYLFFLDSDDQISQDCIEKLAFLAEKYPHTDIVQGSAQVIEKNNYQKKYLLHKSLPEFSDNSQWLKKCLLERTFIPVTSWNKLIRKDFITSNHLFFKEGIVHEDEHWTYFAAKHIRSMSFCKSPTYQHYINEGTIMTTNSIKSIESWFIIIRDFIRNMDKELNNVQQKVILEVSFSNLIRIVKKAPPDTIDALLIKQRKLLQPFMKAAKKHHRIIELFLLSYNYLPVPILRILCMNKIKGIYLRTLKYLA